MTLYQYSGSGFLVPESAILNSNKLTFSSTDVDFSSNLETFNPVNFIEYKVLEGISYSYNRDSLFDDTDDYGSITDVYGLSADYESITQSSGPTIDYGVITANIVGTLATPFGSLTIGGSAITQPNYRLYISGSATAKLSLNFGSLGGTLFTLVDHSEKISYSYNLSSIKIFSSEDYGDITLSPNSITNYGFIAEDYAGEDDYEFISGIASSETIYPFGKLTLSGSAITQPNYRLYVSGNSEYRLIRNYPTSGSLFSFGEKLESVTYDYNNESIVIFDTLDYGSVTQSTNEPNFDSGLISSPPDANIDYGVLVGFGATETLYPFGSITLSGICDSISLRSWSGSGSINLSGSALERFTSSVENTQLFQISGTVLSKDIDSYVASGSLFSFGEKLESVTYDYNESSIITVDIDDYGFISSLYSTLSDFGLISSPITDGTENYGLVGNWQPAGQTTLPFGNIQIYGVGDISFNKGNYNTSGLFSISGFSIEKFVANPPENTQLFNIFGSYEGKLIYSYVGFELISISGTITEKDVDSYVGFGTLTISDSVSESEVEIYTGSGTISLSGIATEKFVANPPENTQLFQISGTSLDRDIDSYVAFGSLFSFGTKLESVTYDYNESSIVLYDILDYGFISQSIDELDEDYESIITPANSNVDYGPITGFGATESLYPFGSLFISGTLVEKDVDSYVGLGTIFLSNQGIPVEIDSYNGSGLIFISGTVVEKDVDSYVGFGTLTISDSVAESEVEIYTGSGTISLSGIATERVTFNPPENTQLFTISGTALESESDSYVGFGTIFVSGTGIEKNTDSYVGLGTLFASSGSAEVYSAQTPENTQLFTISGIATERVTFNPPENTQLFTISGTALESEFDSYVGFGTIFISGELVHPNIDYTPHYGIDKNIGVGTTGIQLYGAASDVYSAQTPENTQLFTISGTALESESEVYIGIGTLHLDISSRNYSPIYPRNTQVPGSGIGTIRINDDSGLTITRAVLPYFTRGTIFVSGTGTESFSKSNYPGTGLFNISGIASTKEIAVYTAVGSGFITLSQTARETDIDSYVGFGTLILSGFSVDIPTYSYSGIGTIFNTSGAAEVFVAQTPEDTQLFTISGSAADAYSAQTPETEVLYQFSGNVIESRTYGYEGSGQVTFGSSAIPIFIPRVFGIGGFRFATYLGDNLYDTCDSVDITCDYRDSAFVKFVANPPENIVLYNFGGSASTTEIQVYTHSGLGSVGISGSHIIKKTNSVVGIGTLTLGSTSIKKDIDSYVGSGSITLLSGSAETKVSVIPSSTILFSFSGSASTKVSKLKRYAGVGTAYFSGSSSTKVLSRPSYSGIGTIFLSGELVYPNIKYIPTPKGAGVINISGSGIEKLGRKYLPVIQPLFFFSGGFESFSKTGYIGVGTIYIQPTSSSTINNPYQIPRVYVTII